MTAIPTYAQTILAPYFDSGVLSTNVSIAIPQHVAMTRFSLSPHKVWVPIGASTDLGQVTIHPDFWPPVSIFSLGLLAHELVHQEQAMRDPNFQYDFAKVAESLPPDAPPEANIYEREAYDYENRVVQDLQRRLKEISPHHVCRCGQEKTYANTSWLSKRPYTTE